MSNLQPSYHELQKKVQELESQVDFYKSFASHASDWEMWFSVDNRLSFVSPSCKIITGYSANEFYQNPSLIFDIVYPLDLEQFVNYCDKGKQHLVDESYLLFRIKSKNGDLRWIEHTCNKVFDESGNFKGYWSSNRNVTEGKIIEAELKKTKEEAEENRRKLLEKNSEYLSITEELRRINEKLYHAKIKAEESNHSYISLFNTITEAICIQDEHGTFLDVNKGTEKMFGYSREEIIGKTQEFLLPSILEKTGILKKCFDKVHATGETQQLECLGLRKNGEVFPRDIVISRYKYLGNDALISVARDITKQKNAEKLLVRTKTHYRTLIQNAPDGIALISPDGKYKFASTSAKRIVGYDHNEPFDRIPGESTHPDDLPKVLSLIDDLIQTPLKTRQIQYRFRHKNGSWIWLESTFSNLLEEPSVEAIVVNFKDISARKFTEIALKEKELQMSTLIELTPDVVFFKDGNGKWLLINQAATRVFNLEGIDYKNKTDDEIKLLVPAREKELEHCKYSDGRAWEKKQPFRGEEIVWDKKEGLKYFDTIKVPLFNTDGTRKGLIIVGRDITENKIAEQERKKLSTAIDQSPVSIEITDLKWDIEYVNQRFIESTEYSYEEVIGENLRDLKLDEISRKEYMKIYETINSGKEWKDEVRSRKKSGKFFWESVSISPIHNFNGEMINCLIIKQDITEKKKLLDELIIAKEEAEKNEMYFRTIYEAQVDPVSITRLSDEKYVLINRGFTNAVGYKPEEIIGKTSADFDIWVNKSDRELMIKKLKKRGFVINFETKIRIKGGDIKIALMSLNIFNYQNEPHILAVSHDITSLKQIQGELIIAKEKAEESERLKSAFLANMSHEIRTPMNGIIGFLNLIDAAGISEKEKGDYLEIVNRSAERLLTTINDIVEVSKIEAKKTVISTSKVDIYQVMENQYKFFKPQADKKGLTFRFSPQSFNKLTKIQTDKYKLESILLNLLKNAIKFTTSGFIELGNYFEGSEIVIYIRDSGRGIPSNQKEAIFERFMQADYRLTRAYEGSGLGLAIAKAYTELLGGKIWVESKEGKESTFYFTLPY